MMQVSEILVHYEESIRFMKSLNTLSNEDWRRPIAPGKWTVAETAGHLAPWDRFILEQRIPYFFGNHPLPEGPGAGELNTRSALESRMRSRGETIDEFVLVRRQLIEALQEVPAADWIREFRIGESRMTLSQYFGEMVEHDLHHFTQIRQVLKAN